MRLFKFAGLVLLLMLAFVSHRGQAAHPGFIDWHHLVEEVEHIAEDANHIFEEAAHTAGGVMHDLRNMIFGQAQPSLFDTESAPVAYGKEDPLQYLRKLFQLDPHCTVDWKKFYYRTLDGSCNWLKEGEYTLGQAGSPFARDVQKTYYADGKSAPREGPNPRTLSNVFFKNTPERTRLFKHTPLLIGFIEWVMHDVQYSKDGEERYDIDIPKCDPDFDPECKGDRKMPFWRTAAVEGTGNATDNPREQINAVSSWWDSSPLYGNTEEVANSLRTFQGGKLKTQKGPDGGDYPPFDPAHPTQFLVGDVRTNQDWFTMAIHTLLLREHNRICDVLQQKNPKWEDWQLYDTARIVITAKMELIANMYQMSYFTDMPWPDDDGLPIFREVFGESVLKINPLHSYPWKYVLVDGRPMVASQEMALGYRFHDLIPPVFPLVNERNETIRNVTILSTVFNATGFVEAGLENVLRGMMHGEIWDFHSGVDDSYRSVWRNLGRPAIKEPFDLVAWSIQHERERGLATYNEYFRAWKGKVPCPPKKSFAEFTSNPEWQQKLAELYDGDVEKVDFIVGQELDMINFPHTVIPTSMVIPSLVSLFGLANSDRFSPTYSFVHCILVGKPWNCIPSNALDELLWEPHPLPLYPNARWLSKFWLDELYISSKGLDGMLKLISNNTGIKCIPKNAFRTYDPVTNPMVCADTK